MRFRGREMAHKEVGRKLLMGMVKDLEDIAVVEIEPKMEGQHLFLIMVGDKKKIDYYKKAQAEKQSSETSADASTGASAE